MRRNDERRKEWMSEMKWHDMKWHEMNEWTNEMARAEMKPVKEWMPERKRPDISDMKEMRGTSEGMSDWESEWVSEWMRRVNAWMNEMMQWSGIKLVEMKCELKWNWKERKGHEWHEFELWMKVWVSEGVTEWVNEWVTEWVSEWAHQRLESDGVEWHAMRWGW